MCICVAVAVGNYTKYTVRSPPDFTGIVSHGCISVQGSFEMFITQNIDDSIVI